MASKKIPTYHTVTTFSAELGCSGMTIRNYVNAGTLKPDATTTDGRALFLPATLVQFRKQLAEATR